MNGVIAVGCVWLIAANVTAMFPSKDHHWRNAYMLIAVGLPLVVWIALAAGWLMAASDGGAGARRVSGRQRSVGVSERFRKSERCDAPLRHRARRCRPPRASASCAACAARRWPAR